MSNFTRRILQGVALWFVLIGILGAIYGCGSGGGGASLAQCIAIAVDCRPERVALVDGKCVCLPTTTTTTTTTTTSTSTTTTSTTIQATPTPTPVPTPTPLPPTCYQGPWRMHCKFPTCDIPGEPVGSVFDDDTDSAATHVRTTQKLPNLLPNEKLEQYVRDVRDELRRRGFCAAIHEDDSKISEDEVAVWTEENAAKEHLDISIGSGSPVGFTKIGEDPFMVARGIPSAPTPTPRPSSPQQRDPLSVRGVGGPGWFRFDGLAFAPSTCTAPSDNDKCFRMEANGAGITWPSDELTCWPVGIHTQKELQSGGMHLITHGGKTMVCPENYPDGGVGSRTHCWDAYGRRVEWVGVWRESAYPDDRPTGWFHQLCPSKN